MRTLSSIAIAALAVAAICPAQTINSPLGQPLTSPNFGNPNGGIYFNLTVTQTVTWVNLNYVSSTGSAAGSSSLNMYVGPGTWVGNVGANPGPWTLVASTAPVAIPAAIATPVTGVLSPAGANTGPTITFAPGSYGIALQAVGHSWGYQNGLLTLPSPGGEFTVVTGGASNGFLALPTFTPRSINGSIDYVVGGTPMPFAQRENYGPGCYAHYRSFYEQMGSTATNQDLSNTSMLCIFDGANNRYSAILPGTTPVDLVNGGVSPSLGHTDDSIVIVNLLPSASPQPILFPNIGGVGIASTTVEMDSNMTVSLLGSTPSTFNVLVASWLTLPAVRIGNWHDTDPGTGGTTHYDFDTTNSAHLFTYVGVPDFGIAGSSNTFQLAFFANGDVEFRWGAMSLLGGGAWPTLVGFSPGTSSLDPGTTDLSVRLPQLPPLSTSNVDRHPLTLNASTNPVLGSTVNLVTSNETGLSIGVTFIGIANLPGFSPAGLDLGIIGAPGCVANINISPSASGVINNIAPNQMTVAFPIPATPMSLVGQSFFCQSIWVDPLAQNQFFDPLTGMLTSNAVRLRLGAF